MLGALDKLNVQADTFTIFRREFQEFVEPAYRSIRACNAEDKKLPKGWRQTEWYGAVGRLDEFGIEGMFHGWYRGKRNDGRQTHKIELWNVGDHGRSRIYADLERIVSQDPGDLPTMRIDCCADVPVPMSFVPLHVRVAKKRRGATVIEELPMQYQHIFGKGNTCYFGTRDNGIRAYDKVAELKHQFKMQLRKFARESSKILGADRDGNVLRPLVYEGQLPTFQETYGIAENSTLTRVERYINGTDHIPPQFSKVRNLDTLHEFDPFEDVVIYAAENSEFPQPGDQRFTFAQYNCGMWLRQLQHGMGLEYVRQYIRQQCPSNYRREFETYSPFLKPLFPEEDSTFTREDLTEVYRENVRRQLAA